MLTCPYCETEFELTWKRYWLAPLGVHVCPVCGRKSRFAFTTKSFAASIGVNLCTVLPGMGIAAIVLALFKMPLSRQLNSVSDIFPWAILVMGGLLAAIFVTIPLGKATDTHFRYLVPLKNHDSEVRDQDKGHWVVDE